LAEQPKGGNSRNDTRKDRCCSDRRAGEIYQVYGSTQKRNQPGKKSILGTGKRDKGKVIGRSTVERGTSWPGDQDGSLVATRGLLRGKGRIRVSRKRTVAGYEIWEGGENGWKPEKSSPAPWYTLPPREKAHGGKRKTGVHEEHLPTVGRGWGPSLTPLSTTGGKRGEGSRLCDKSKLFIGR